MWAQLARTGAVRWGFALLILATIQAGAAEPRRALLLHSYGPDSSPWAETAASFRAESLKTSPFPNSLYQASLVTARFEMPQKEEPAASFGRRYRTSLFALTPMLIAGVAGGDARFAELSAWQRYGWQITLVGLVLLLQTALIIGLLYERRRRRLAEAEVCYRMAELAHVSRRATAGELLASISHEVNQPLAAIVANASVALRWLAKPVPDLDSTKGVLTNIVQDGHRASQIIGTIRAMFKKESDRQTAIDFNEVIGDVTALLGGELRRRNIVVEANLTGGIPPILADRVQLQQLVVNLVMNAAEAMEAVVDRPRTLRLASSSTPEGDVVVTVADSGPGIAAEKADHIFDAFYTTKADGMGMGLAICRSIVTSLEGKITVANQTPHGSIFTIRMPSIARRAPEPVDRIST